MAVIKKEIMDYYRRNNLKAIEDLKRDIAWLKMHGHDTCLAGNRLRYCIKAEERSAEIAKEWRYDENE